MDHKDLGKALFPILYDIDETVSQRDLEIVQFRESLRAGGTPDQEIERTIVCELNGSGRLGEMGKRLEALSRKKMDLYREYFGERVVALWRANQYPWAY